MLQKEGTYTHSYLGSRAAMIRKKKAYAERLPDDEPGPEQFAKSVNRAALLTLGVGGEREREDEKSYLTTLYSQPASEFLEMC